MKPLIPPFLIMTAIVLFLSGLLLSLGIILPRFWPLPFANKNNSLVSTQELPQAIVTATHQPPLETSGWWQEMPTLQCMPTWWATITPIPTSTPTRTPVGWQSPTPTQTPTLINEELHER